MIGFNVAGLMWFVTVAAVVVATLAMMRKSYSAIEHGHFDSVLLIIAVYLFFVFAVMNGYSVYKKQSDMGAEATREEVRTYTLSEDYKSPEEINADSEKQAKLEEDKKLDELSKVQENANKEFNEFINKGEE